jgi:hypothetical protein
MIVRKITTGFVIQEFDTETQQFVSQNFTASDGVDWEDEDGNAIDPDDFVAKADGTLPYLEFDMVPPAYMNQEAPTEDEEVEERRIK